MIIVRFPIDPICVPNETCDCPGNTPDIVLQGHRRSLADWLVICQKTLADHQRLMDSGLSVRQALVYGLPFTPVPHRKDTELLFASVPPFTPETLSDLDVRVNRLISHMHLYCDMPEDFRTPWARRLLVQCYACWRKKRVWRPCHEDWYPHAKVLPLDPAERKDVDAWRYLLPVYLDGNWIDGFYPTERLEKFYAPKLSKQADYRTWSEKIRELNLNPAEVVSVEAMAKALGVHKYSLYRSWSVVGVQAGSGKTRTAAEWLSLAINVDALISVRKAKRNLKRKRNMQR